MANSITTINGGNQMPTIAKRIEENIEFDKSKFIELWVYIAKKSESDERFGATKLDKIFYFCDFEAYREFGKPMTGADYKHQQMGALPNQYIPIRDEIEGDDIEIVEGSYHGRRQKRTIAKREPDLTGFTEDELTIVDRVIDRLWLYDATSVGRLSQEEIGYKLTEKDEIIPYTCAYFLATPLTEEQITIGTQVAKRHGFA